MLPLSAATEEEAAAAAFTRAATPDRGTEDSVFWGFGGAGAGESGAGKSLGKSAH